MEKQCISYANEKSPPLPFQNYRRIRLNYVAVLFWLACGLLILSFDMYYMVNSINVISDPESSVKIFYSKVTDNLVMIGKKLDKFKFQDTKSPNQPNLSFESECKSNMKEFIKSCDPKTNPQMYEVVLQIIRLFGFLGFVFSIMNILIVSTSLIYFVCGKIAFNPSTSDWMIVRLISAGDTIFPLNFIRVFAYRDSASIFIFVFSLLVIYAMWIATMARRKPWVVKYILTWTEDKNSV